MIEDIKNLIERTKDDISDAKEMQKQLDGPELEWEKGWQTALEHMLYELKKVVNND